MKAVNLFLLCAFVISISACSQSDYESYSSDVEKIALYRQKSQEFAEKYGIHMCLNESNLQELIRTTTIKEMEEDIEMLSKMIINVNQTKGDVPAKKKMKIRKKISISEAHEPREGFFEFIDTGHSDWIEGTVEWYYRPTGISSIDVSFSYPRASSYSAHISPVYMNYNHGVSFEVYGTYRFYGMRYSFDKFVSISYNEKTNYKKVSIGSF